MTAVFGRIAVAVDDRGLSGYRRAPRLHGPAAGECRSRRGEAHPARLRRRYASLRRSRRHRALVVQEGASWIAVVGIPLAAPARTANGDGASPGGRREIDFTVGEKRYASQSLKVAPRQVNLIRRRSGSGQPRTSAHRAGHAATGASRRRIRCAVPRRCPECAAARSACAASSTENRATRTAGWTSRPPPAPRCCCRSPERCSIRASSSSPAIPCSSITAADFISMYCHLSAIDVQPGEHIAAGDANRRGRDDRARDRPAPALGLKPQPRLGRSGALPSLGLPEMPPAASSRSGSDRLRSRPRQG